MRNFQGNLSCNVVKDRNTREVFDRLRKEGYIMKKMSVLLLVQLLVFGTACYGAVSDDVYVRKDVFEAKMEAFMTEIRGEFQVMNAKIDALSRRVDDNYHSLENRMNDLEKRMDDKFISLEKRMDDLEKRTDDKFIKLEKKIDDNYSGLEKRIDDSHSSLEKRIDDKYGNLEKRMDNNYYSLDARISDLRNGLYLGLILFGTVVGLPFFNKWREEKQKEKEEQRRPSITLEDVMRLIEEHDAKLSGKTLQGL